jgi:hypothetical protein
MEAAAKSNLKKISLELGGKSPHLVFESADLDQGAFNNLFTIIDPEQGAQLQIGLPSVFCTILVRTVLQDLVFMFKTQYMTSLSIFSLPNSSNTLSGMALMTRVRADLWYVSAFLYSLRGRVWALIYSWARRFQRRNTTRCGGSSRQGRRKVPRSVLVDRRELVKASSWIQQVRSFWSTESR